MKQLLILSGKGGTGKTTVASAFIELSKSRAYADCDVDAPNLHLLMEIEEPLLSQEFYGLQVAHINRDLCIDCGICYEACRFNSILNEPFHTIDITSCEGCALCYLVCPQEAISMHDNSIGKLKLYKDTRRVFSTAQLYPGAGNSGLLVSEVKAKMKDHLLDYTDLAIIDGSPGIGCPVIASLSGVDATLLVAEPSISGISDLKRVVKTAKSFDLQILVCVNKYDLNLEKTKEIEEFCQESNLLFVGKIPYDIKVLDYVNKKRSLEEIDSLAIQALKELYQKTMEALGYF